MPTKPDFKIAGTPRFRFEPVVSRHLDFRAETVCLGCGRPMVVTYGVHMATFRIGREFVGLSCDECLSTESRQQVRELREQDGVVRLTG